MGIKGIVMAGIRLGKLAFLLDCLMCPIVVILIRFYSVIF